MITVYNIRKEKHEGPDVYYIGRPSVLGNPYTHIQDKKTRAEFIVNTREEAVNAYEQYFHYQYESDEKFSNLIDEIYHKHLNGAHVYLGCFCAPAACHGDIIKKILDGWVESTKQEAKQAEIEKRKKECRPCVVLKQYTYDGIVREQHQIQLTKPIEQIRQECMQLNKRLREQNKKGVYTCAIKVNPQDNKSFASAEIRFGKRAIIYTNVATSNSGITKIKNITYFKSTYTKALSSTPIPKSQLKKWIKDHVAKWLAKGYKGYAKEKVTAEGSLYYGYFEDKNNNKSFILDSQYIDKKTVTIIIEQKGYTTTEVTTKSRLKDLETDINNEMIANGYQGQIKVRSGLNGAPIVSGLYKKYVETATCKYDYTIQIHNEAEKNPKIIFNEGQDFRPTKKIGKTVVQVRSIAQDDTYTPEFRGKKINWDRIEIEKLYKEYMQMPANELELSQKRFEAMDERAATKGDKTALKWLRSLKKSRPSWLQAPNAESLVLYCVKYLKQEIMTISEANNFCKRNAYKKTSV